MLSIALFSCQKDDSVKPVSTDQNQALSENEAKFLQLSELKSGSMKEKLMERIKQDLKRKNRSNHFIEKIANKLGYPDWELSWPSLSEDGNDTIVMTPLFVINDTCTNGILISIFHKSKIRYVLLERGSYKICENNASRGITPENLKKLFAYFDFKKFYEPLGYPVGKANGNKLKDYLVFYNCQSSWNWNCWEVKGGSNCGWIESSVCAYDIHWVGGNNDSDYPGGGTSSGNPCTDCGGGGGSGGDPPPTAPIIVIDPTFLNSKANCVKTQLEDGNTTTLFDKLVQFFGPSNPIPLTFTIGILNNASGKTSAESIGPKLNSITITISEEQLLKSNLEIAETLLHEAFHAYIFGKLYGGDNSSGITPEPDFARDFEKYRLLFYPEPYHNYMATYYRNFMIEGLQTFYSQSPEYANVDSYASANYTAYHGLDDLFSTLAWMGLENTEAYIQYMSNPTNATNYNFYLNSIVRLLPKKDCP